ncbi:hypothetical protein [Nostoc sp.]|uniref:hypothetical protein n=1 Tax=Nostoc sp. TaxID=1180 RepID=UPI002FF69DC2
MRKPTLEEWRTDRENSGSRQLPLTPLPNDYHFHAEGDFISSKPYLVLVLVYFILIPARQYLDASALIYHRRQLH